VSSALSRTKPVTLLFVLVPVCASSPPPSSSTFLLSVIGEPPASAASLPPSSLSKLTSHPCLKRCSLSILVQATSNIGKGYIDPVIHYFPPGHYLGEVFLRKLGIHWSI